MTPKPRFLKVDKTVLEYTLVRSTRRRRTVAIQVRPNRDLIVRVPQAMPVTEVDKLLSERATWIITKLSEVDGRSQAPKMYSDGEAHPYLGLDHVLTLSPTVGPLRKVAKKPGRIIISVPFDLASEARGRWAQEALRAWYLEQAKKEIPRIVNRLARETGLSPKKVVIKNLKRSWGMCGADGSLSLNWRLVLAPPRIIEYITAHELCHLRQLNHSRQFYALLKSVQPDYVERRRELLELGPLLETY